MSEPRRARRLDRLAASVSRARPAPILLGAFAAAIVLRLPRLPDDFRALAATPLYRPIVYLVLAIVLLARRRSRAAHGALLASGLAYEATIFIAAPSTDFRYSHWMIVTVVAAAAILAATRVPAWRRADPSAAG